MLGVKPGLTILNIGSGTGDIAMELARYADVNVVGVEANHSRVQHAIRRVQDARLSHKITFIHASLDELLQRFSASSFDMILAVESLKGACSFDSIYGDLSRLLKSGGKIGIVEWCWTASFNPAIPDHRRLAAVMESSSHLSEREPDGRSIHAASTALSNAGLAILHAEDLSTRHDRIPWYAPLEKAVSDSRAPWSCSEGELFPMFGGLSRNTAIVIIEAAKWGLFTPLALFVAQKVT